MVPHSVPKLNTGFTLHTQSMVCARVMLCMGCMLRAGLMLRWIMVRIRLMLHVQYRALP